jgi:PAS domain S-box-containing protein
MKNDLLISHLSSVLNDDFNLTLEDVEMERNAHEKEIIYGLICIHEDLTFHKTQSNLIISNFKNTLFNSAAILITDPKGVIKEVNLSLTELTGYTKEELIGQQQTIIKSGYHPQKFFDRLQNDLSSGKTWRGEICHKKKDGGLFWVNAHIFPMKNLSGEISEFWFVCTDITDKKQIEIELYEKNIALKDALEKKELFNKEIHHRVKNNLQLLSSILSLQSKNGKQYTQEELIGGILTKINSISSLHSLLYHKTEYGVVDLKEYLIGTFSPVVASASEATTLIINGENFEIGIDSCKYLGLTINELIFNSIKYAWINKVNIKKEITINYSLDETHTTLHYSDNGSGYAFIKDSEGLGNLLITTFIEEELVGTYETFNENGFHIKMKFLKQNLAPRY